MVSKHLDTERTWICCVLFADIGGYSAQPVQQQMEWKTRFNDFLNDALAGVDREERYVLDTGDGAAVCFLGPPEPAMHAALKLRKAVVKDRGTRSDGMRLRIGINLGPLRLMKDVNGRVNAVGDAINVSQRVMNFAELDQILVSRSFYETVSRLSEESPRMFASAGMRKDKNGREHVLYELCGEELTSPSCAENMVVQHLQTIRSVLLPLLGPIADRLIAAEQEKSANLAELFPRLIAHLRDERSRESFTQAWEKEFPPADSLPSSPAGTELHAQLAPGQERGAFNELATRELARFIGPMAKIIVARVAERYKSSKELVDALCEEIQSEKDRESFRRSVVQSTLPEAKTAK
jgi:class 3 adenylate cyclase